MAFWTLINESTYHKGKSPPIISSNVSLILEQFALFCGLGCLAERIDALLQDLGACLIELWSTIILLEVCKYVRCGGLLLGRVSLLLERIWFGCIQLLQLWIDTGCWDLAASDEWRFVILELLTEADRGIRSLNTFTKHITGVLVSQRLLILWQLLHEYLSCVLVVDKFADLLSEILRLKFITHLGNELQTCTEVQLIHVVKHFLAFIVHDTQADSVQALFVHAFLKLN